MIETRARVASRGCAARAATVMGVVLRRIADETTDCCGPVDSITTPGTERVRSDT